LVHCFFFEYSEREVKIICTESDTNTIAFVAKCEFNNEKQLTRYLEGIYTKHGNGEIYIKQWNYTYNANDIYVSFNIYSRDLTENSNSI